MTRTKTTTCGDSNKRRRLNPVPESSNAAEMRRDRGNSSDSPISSSSSSSSLPRSASQHYSSSSSLSSGVAYEDMERAARATIKREMDLLDASTGGFIADPITDDLHLWEGHVTGLAGRPYVGGAFFLSIKFPPHFPNVPPRVLFKTQDIFYPNISKKGFIGLEILELANWTRVWSIDKILGAIVELLRRPRMEPETIVLQPEVAKIYKEDFGLYLATPQSWTNENILRK